MTASELELLSSRIARGAQFPCGKFSPSRDAVDAALQLQPSRAPLRHSMIAEFGYRTDDIPRAQHFQPRDELHPTSL